MYPRKRFSSSGDLKTMTLPHALPKHSRIFLTFFAFFALQAFVHADANLHPFESNRFFKAYATLQQSSAHVFENIPLRAALKNIQAACGVTIWLDRRIDGEQIVQMKPGKRSHIQCLEELCQQSASEIAWLENILYIAPLHQSSKIEFAYWNLFTLRGADAWQKKGKPIAWTFPSDVKGIFENAMRLSSIKLNGLETLEHDIWGPATVPEASIAAQWSCLLAGYNSSITTDAQRRWHVNELSKVNDVPFVYVQQLAKTNPKRLEEWRAKWPAAKIVKTRNGSMSITAPVAAHRELLAATIQVKENRPDTKATWSLEYKGELGRLLEALAQQMDLQISPSPLPGEVAARQIEIKVKDASIDKLLEEVSKQLGIPVSLEGNNIMLNVP
jgi:type II secretory pathway component GspD/PulD (secretin)